jgi:hypothetical protein
MTATAAEETGDRGKFVGVLRLGKAGVRRGQRWLRRTPGAAPLKGRKPLHALVNHVIAVVEEAGTAGGWGEC